MIPLSLTLFNIELSGKFKDIESVEAQTPGEIFTFLKTHSLFNWHLNNNFCEARAEAVSLLLCAAKIPHVKSWVMGAAFLKKGYVGGLKNNWNYHVAIALPVRKGDKIDWMVVDPSAALDPLLVEDWAASITAYSHSYYFLKDPGYYIFPENKLFGKGWHKRRQRNFKWTMQGLLGFSSLSNSGKAKLAFKKRQIREVTRSFMKVRGEMGAAGHSTVRKEGEELTQAIISRRGAETQGGCRKQ
jgi:Glutaminase